MALAAAAWTPTDAGHQEPIPPETAQAAENMSLLLAHLTEPGRTRFLGELHEAANRGDADGPGSVKWVLEGWWWTLMLRHQPGYVEAIQEPLPAPGGPYQTVGQLRAEVDALIAGRE